MRLMYIQYAGDFAEAYERLYKKGGKENYYGQAYSVGGVVDQARRGIEVMVLVTKSDGYIKKIENRLLSVGIKKKARFRHLAIISRIISFKPDRVILRMPDWQILMFLRYAKIKVFPVFADSFETIKGIRGKIGKKILSKELCNPNIDWVANHQLNASKSVENLGVNPKKILPYDWIHPFTPTYWSHHIDPKLEEKEILIFYAGNIKEEKGVLDLIKALKYLLKLGRKAKIRIAGDGNKKAVIECAESVGVLRFIEFLGVIPHEDVLREMNNADVVVVPSHHSYPEGLPMTIMESLLVQTPLVVSDHPMFVGRIRPGLAVEIFPEKKPAILAEKIYAICKNVDEYKKRCESAVVQWSALTLKLKWVEMIDRWIANSNDPFLYEHSLYSLKYD